MSLNTNHENAYVPKRHATKQQNNKQVGKTAKNRIVQVDLE